MFWLVTTAASYNRENIAFFSWNGNDCESKSIACFIESLNDNDGHELSSVTKEATTDIILSRDENYSW